MNTPATPGLRRRRSDSIVKTPEQLAADAEAQTFRNSLKAQGGKMWVSADGSKVRYYFERTDAQYDAEVVALREAAGGELAVWPQKKLGYVDIKTREFVSTRDGVSNADFKASLGF